MCRLTITRRRDSLTTTRILLAGTSARSRAYVYWRETMRKPVGLQYASRGRVRSSKSKVYIVEIERCSGPDRSTAVRRRERREIRSRDCCVVPVLLPSSSVLFASRFPASRLEICVRRNSVLGGRSIGDDWPKRATRNRCARTRARGRFVLSDRDSCVCTCSCAVYRRERCARTKGREGKERKK